MLYICLGFFFLLWLVCFGFWFLFHLFNCFFVLFKEPVSFFGIFVDFVCLEGSALVWAFLKAI